MRPGVVTPRGIERRAAIIAFVREFGAEHGYGPTYSEVAVAVGCSLSTAAYHIGELVRSGELTQLVGGPRTLRVPAVQA